MSILRALWGPPGERRDIFANGSIIPSVEAYTSTVSQESATRIVTVLRCNQLIADAVATLPVHAYERDGKDRIETDPPTWLKHPVPENPNATWIDHLTEGMWSYGLDGNIFVLVLPNVYDPAALYVIDPAKVECRKGPKWRISLDSGREDVGPDQMVHIARSKKAGTLRGMSPIDEAALELGTYRAAQRFGRKVFDNGVFISGYVALPGPAGVTVTDELKAEINEQYGGANQFKPGVFANGAEWKVPQISLEQLQFMDLQKMGKLTIATLYGVPPYKVGVTDPGAMAYNSTESQGIDWEKDTIRPIVERLEGGYDRLIPGTGYLKLDTKGLLRGDFKTRTEGYHNLLGDKVMRPAEVRALEDLPPDPEMPGYLETPNNNAPSSGRQVAA